MGRGFGVLALGLIAAARMLTQGINGSLTGLVTDPTDAPVPGARIVVTNLNTGLIARTTTNSSGVFNLASVPIGTYEIRIEAPGFKTFVKTGLLVETAQTVRVDARLEVGSLQESVTVTAEAPLLQRETSSVSTQVSSEMVHRLPFQLTGAMRNPFAFVRLTPGATGTSSPADGVRMAGGRIYGSEVFVDGVPLSYHIRQNVAGPTAPALDSVAEFRVKTALPPAEYGRTSGGVVLMATRSGTNQLRGNVTLLLRNNVLDARRFNARIPDITRQGEYSGSLGGPLVLPRLYKGVNRTFFFTNYTGFDRINEVQGQSATVPTQRMRQGDFGEAVERIFDPQSADSTGQRAPFPNNSIPASRISRFALKAQEAIPLPNLPGIVANFTRSNPAIANMKSSFLKLDHAISDNHRASGSYRINWYPSIYYNGILSSESDRVDQFVRTQSVIVSDDLILRPNLLHRIQVGFTRFRTIIWESDDIGLQVPGAFASGFPGVRFAGQGLAPIGYGNDRSTFNNHWSLQDSISWTRGKHNFKFGGRIDCMQQNLRQLGFREGQYTFSQFGTSQPQVAGTGHSYASFLLGLVSNATIAYNMPYGFRSQYYAVYVQDDWKLTGRLTVNYGLRWETQRPFYEPAGRVSMMDPTLPNPAAGGLPGALIFGGKGPGRTGVKTFLQPYYGGWGPRLGLAWQAASKTVIRAGAGLFYSSSAGLYFPTQGFNTSVTINSQDGGLTPVFHIDQGWPPGLLQYPPFISPTLANGAATTTLETRRGGSGRMPRTSQWQLGMQRTIADILLEANYVGTVSHGIGNNALVNLNQVHPRYLSLGALLTRNIADPAVAAAGFRPPYPGFRGTLAQSLRAFPQYMRITTFDAPTGNSTYHGLLVKSEKRLRHGLQFLVAYAFEKTISDVHISGDGDLAGPQDQFNRRAEKALANSHVPQTLTVSFTYELPFGRGKLWATRGVMSVLAGHWSVAGILDYRAGGVIRVETPNSLPIFNGHLRPNRVGNIPIRIGPKHGSFQPLNILSGQVGDLFLNRQAFDIPAPFTFGNLGVFLPDVFSFGSRREDLSLIRKLYAREAVQAEIRADFFNSFNRKNLGSPVADITNPNFGRILGSGPARIVQLGFRLDF
jgi:hypothetical protein